MSIRSYQDSSRNWSAQSLSVGSAAGASTAIFSTQTYQVRIVSDTAVRYIIGDSPSVNSTTIAGTGSMLPANVIEWVSVSPGQRASFVAPTTSVAGVSVTETSA